MEKSERTVTRRSTSSIPCPANVRTMESLLSVAPLLEDITERVGLGMSINDADGNLLFTSKGYRRLLEAPAEIYEDAIVVELEDRVASLRLLSAPCVCDDSTFLLTKMALIGEVSVGMAHDIRNILVALDYNLHEIKTAVSRHLEEAGFGDLRESLGEMAQALEAARQICFRVERLASKKDETRPTNMSVLVPETIRMAGNLLRKAEAEGKRITLESDVREGLWVNAIPSEVQMAIINIISNALSHGFDAGDEGLISVKGFRSGRNVCLTIANDGKPIPQGVQDLLLAAPVVSSRGHGFGLYTAMRALSSFGASLEVSSGPGVTIFMITLSQCGGLQ
jgi:signal transduction histidine kinase